MAMEQKTTTAPSKSRKGHGYQGPIGDSPEMHHESGHDKPGLQKGIRNRASLVSSPVPDYSGVMNEINAKHNAQPHDLLQMSTAIRSKGASGAV